MFYYWLSFLLPLIGALSPVSLIGRARIVPWAILVVFVVLLVGLRHQIGGDWANYVDLTNRVSEEPFGFFLNEVDPGYVFINAVSTRAGWGIYGVNLISSVIFLAGLARFCWKQPLPSLAWLVATPYLIIVVGMGYTRQSVALGVIMVALLFLQERKIWKFVLLILVAFTFHRSAVLLLPLALSCVDRAVLEKFGRRFYRKRKFTSYFGIGTVLIGLAIFIIFQGREFYYAEIKAYIHGSMWHSEGGVIRVVMNAVPAIFLLSMSRRWDSLFGDSRIWCWLSCFAVASVVGVLFFSTLTDRLGLNLLPLQIYVVSRVPILFHDAAVRTASILGICILYGVIMFIWLNFAEHAYYWVPYENLVLP